MSRSRNKLVMLSGMNNETVERYRALRAQIDRTGGGSGAPSVIAVAAPKAGSGTAEMAANLAIAYAQADRRTLLVDGEMNVPLIHQLFGLLNVVGLSSIIEASSTAEDVVNRGVINNLDVITAGPRLPYSKDFVGSYPLQPLFVSWRQQYDQICIATPSLLSSADAQLITAACDGVLLVIRSGWVDENDASRVKRLLALLDVPALGVALAHG
ncbi:CpsD/CapB family tyrosine-protein kinase [Paenibacillus sp. PR3]|uniref:CpsD/CapB family tyrosine-protein kinase n=1 Tax=Paenibacillus terricola TaxID=2763503 RepID=A0ABR8N1L1_9BACL|nr:CpsD/CapB family tyrosine-protein kinase [Paenibacillus terricola]MBD3920684.1 CpsD/CapB family tyrosine-protein kinase [Paenibacillus terricola]